MKTLCRSMIVITLCALPVLAFAAGNATEVKPLPSAQMHRVSITATNHGELITESEVDILEGYPATIQNGHANAALPDCWIGLSIGSETAGSDMPADAPIALQPYLKHTTSGALDVWYYLPGCDQLEVAWSSAEMSVLKASIEKANSLSSDSVAKAECFKPAGRVSFAISN
jgi:hypothetical protein